VSGRDPERGPGRSDSRPARESGDAHDGDGGRGPDSAPDGPAGEAETTPGGSTDEDGRPDGEDDPVAPLVPGQDRAGVGESGAPDLSAPERARRATDGTRSDAAPGTDGDGPRVRTRRADDAESVDAAASVRAAAARGASSVGARDLRRSVRAGSTGALVLFVVDASASMRPAMESAKGVVLELLKDAYQHRDEVAFVAFAGQDAGVVLPPTDSVTRAARHLKELPSGDRTPLPAGLRTATEVLERADPDPGLVVLVTDGRANVAGESPVGETREAARRLGGASDHVLVVDAGDPDAAGLTDQVVAATDGERVPLAALSADRLDAAVE